MKASDLTDKEVLTRLVDEGEELTEVELGEFSALCERLAEVPSKELDEYDRRWAEEVYERVFDRAKDGRVNRSRKKDDPDLRPVRGPYAWERPGFRALRPPGDRKS